ncbi:hypothetical protein BJV78DRAFT_1214991 [Lactifluus subvellereus]|nr:hypothetical protein BJV78DRAFT_1214991 [Lactifluus subvellereus]
MMKTLAAHASCSDSTHPTRYQNIWTKSLWISVYISLCAFRKWMLVRICQAFPLVDLTAIEAAKKRGLEVEDGSENEKPQKFAPAQEHDVLAACWALPPSDAAAMPAFQNEQEKRPVLNGRPLYNSGPPIGLFHPVFNSFHAAMRDPESSYADATTYPLVKALFEAFSGIYDSEDLRIAAIDKHLSPLLESRFEVVQVQGVKSDGVIAESCGPYSVHAYVAIREVKNEIGTASTDPYNQASLAYRKYWADSSRDGIRARCYCPNLILAIAGPWLCVLGGVYLQKAVIQPLTDYVWLGGDAFNADRVVFASQLFTALKSVISTLWMYYRSLDFSDATVQTEMPDPFPFIQEYESKKFTYLSRLAPEYPGKLLYKARLQVDNRFVLHRLAPPLHYAGTEHAGGQTYGGRYMVVMDFIDGNLLVDSLSKRQLERVKQAIKLLHSRDLVFGDLRLPNILVKDESVMFVDFDWCGKAGEARYPATLNNDVRLGWPMGVGPGFVMLKEHDLSMLEKLQ